MSDLIARRYIISGRVQGVGFRYFAERIAREYGVAGWVRNVPDGTVEIYATGKAEQIEGFEALVRRGPLHADVRGFESREDPPSHAKTFKIV